METIKFIFTVVGISAISILFLLLTCVIIKITIDSLRG